ncbi:MAG TPA: hypothetical protein VJX10_18325 [Pseudonocardiaceae bacterium]|nr:hypothetical protein [Pseudonocardiaceae bacterium]
MTVVETILVYVLIPAAIYGVIALCTLGPNRVRSPKYRPGQPWPYEPVWWSAAGVVDPRQTGAQAEHAPVTPTVRTARGGARGNW